LTIQNRGNVFTLIGHPDTLELGARTLEKLYAMTDNAVLTPDLVHLVLTEVSSYRDGATQIVDGEASIEHVLRTPKLSVKPRTPQQNNYVQAILKHDINFGIGPAGTGKTYLAVACAVEALVSERVSRILLVRPAVEAGEKLGF